MSTTKIVLTECAARTLLMVLENRKAYTSGLQADAVKLLADARLINYGGDTYGEFITLAPNAQKAIIEILQRDVRAFN